MDKAAEDIFKSAQAEIENLLSEAAKFGKISKQQEDARTVLEMTGTIIQEAGTKFAAVSLALGQLAEKLFSLDASTIEEQLKSIRGEFELLAERNSAEASKLRETLNTLRSDLVVRVEKDESSFRMISDAINGLGTRIDLAGSEQKAINAKREQQDILVQKVEAKQWKQMIVVSLCLGVSILGIVFALVLR